MRLPWAFIKRDALLATSYRTAFVMQLAAIFMVVPLYFFVGKLFGAAAGEGVLAEYGGNYFAFLLIGMAFVDYLAVSLRTFNQSLRDSQLMGTLEIVLLSPTSLTRLLLYSSLWVYMFTTLRFVLYLLGGWAFGLSLENVNLLGGVLTLVLGVLSFAALGIMSASVVMVIKHGNAMNSFLTFASLFLGGVLYPVSVMPEWLQHVAQLLPITHALHGMRQALLLGASTADLAPTFGILLLFAGVLFPLALLSFYAAVRWTKASGSLAQY